MYYLQNEAGADQGPYSLDALSEKLQKGEIQRDALIRPQYSPDWQQLFNILPSAGSQPPPVSSQPPPVPQFTLYPTGADTSCFVTVSGERKGPYLQQQLRKMWENGSITADATVDWVGCVEPLSIQALLQGPTEDNQVGATVSVNDSPKSTDIFAILCFATGMLGLLMLPIIFVPISYVTAIISYYRLKENPHLTGHGIRLTGAIAASVSILWMHYLYRSSDY